MMFCFSKSIFFIKGRYIKKRILLKFKNKSMRVQLLEKCGFTPDSSRIVARYFMNGDPRTKMLSHIMTLDENKS
jgi:hypothetical protein